MTWLYSLSTHSDFSVHKLFTCRPDSRKKTPNAMIAAWSRGLNGSVVDGCGHNEKIFLTYVGGWVSV